MYKLSKLIICLFLSLFIYSHVLAKTNKLTPAKKSLIDSIIIKEKFNLRLMNSFDFYTVELNKMLKVIYRSQENKEQHQISKDEKNKYIKANKLIVSLLHTNGAQSKKMFQETDIFL